MFNQQSRAECRRRSRLDVATAQDVVKRASFSVPWLLLSFDYDVGTFNVYHNKSRRCHCPLVVTRCSRRLCPVRTPTTFVLSPAPVKRLQTISSRNVIVISTTPRRYLRQANARVPATRYGIRYDADYFHCGPSMIYGKKWFTRLVVDPTRCDCHCLFPARLISARCFSSQLI